MLEKSGQSLSRKSGEMEQTDVKKLVEKASGLHVDTIGKGSFNRVINERMRLLGVKDPSAYAEMLRRNPEELAELIEDVVVPETWFFRDHFPFAAMVEHLLNTWDRTHPIRLLSIPCSSGEEPYSIAMALILTGIQRDLFQIDAADISVRALKRAARGEYTKNSFRSKDLRFRDIFFTPINNRYQIHKEIRQYVRFFQGSLLDSSFIELLGAYDVLFSRNILIYFSQEVQRKAIANIERLLKPGGILFTGHAEAALFLDTSFFPLHYQRAFAFGKNRDNICLAQPLLPVRQPPADRRTAAPSAPPAVTAPRGEESAAADPGEKLDEARRLADQGEADRALTICEHHLALYGPSAAAFFLLGVIHDSQGRFTQAMEHLRKALYLEPRHYETLTLLALLAERAGDETGARNYRRRARKIEEGG